MYVFSTRSMRPHNVHSALLVGPTDVQKTSFLFQFAVHFADQGIRVLYISPTALEALPPPIHGVSPPSSAALSLIRFMYLPRWKDLLQHLYSVHQHAHVSSVMVVEGLDHYFHLEQPRDEKHEDMMHAALVCASLLDAVSVCAKRVGRPGVLISALQPCKIKLNPLINTFFSDIVWLTDCVNSDGTVTMANMSIVPECTHKVIEFKSRKADGALVLKIVKLFCNLENKPAVQNICEEQKQS